MIGVIVGLVLSAAQSQAEITVYNQGFGLVKEVRQLKFKKGRQNIAIEDVASMIEPTSVGFRSLTDKNSFTVLEQNYQYDLINAEAILNKSVGQPIRFVRSLGNQKEVLTGTLLSAPTAVISNTDGSTQQTYTGMVIRTDDGRIVLDPTGEVEVRSIPTGLISKPTLMWDVDSVKAGNDSVELSYITQGIKWNADYVLTLDGAGKADLQGWVTIDNKSGASWKDAKLKLLAGDVNRLRPLMQNFAVPDMNTGALNVMSAPAFQEESLFEYHLYTLGRPATVRNNETKQLSLLTGQGIPVHKKLIVDSIGGSYYPGEGEIGTGDIKPQVRLEFINDQKSGLGMALPKGNVKVYQRDQSGSVQLLGEDQINHTPRNEKISLNVGKSFDVVSTRKRMSYHRISDRAFREVFEIEVRNRKEMPETVYVFERHYGDWRITEKNQAFTKIDSNTAQFVVDLKPNEAKKVVYTVETRW